MVKRNSWLQPYHPSPQPPDDPTLNMSPLPAWTLMHIQLRLMSSIHVRAHYEYPIYMYIKYPVMSVHVRRKYQFSVSLAIDRCLGYLVNAIYRRKERITSFLCMRCVPDAWGVIEKESTAPLVESRKSRLNMPVEKEKAGGPIAFCIRVSCVVKGNSCCWT
jgi:hypothetical protein